MLIHNSFRLQSGCGINNSAVNKQGPCIYRVGVDNFVMVNGREASDMSKVSEFCLEKAEN